MSDARTKLRAQAVARAGRDAARRGLLEDLGLVLAAAVHDRRRVARELTKLEELDPTTAREHRIGALREYLDRLDRAVERIARYRDTL